MLRTRTAAASAVAVLALIVGACGGDDDTGTANPSGGGETRTIEIDMVDITFEPDTLQVAPGETVRLVFTNRGQIAHDAFVGDAEAQADHEADMRQDDEGHGGGHGDDSEEAEDAVTVEPGDTGELVYTFDEPGTYEVGCHQPGHYDAGMKIIVDVG